MISINAVLIWRSAVWYRYLLQKLRAHLYKLRYYYRPQRSCEVYVFTSVCLSTGGAWSGGWYPSMHWGRPLPGETATAAGGTHPTGMHSCYYYYFDHCSVLVKLDFNWSWNNKVGTFKNTSNIPDKTSLPKSRGCLCLFFLTDIGASGGVNTRFPLFPVAKYYTIIFTMCI